MPPLAADGSAMALVRRAQRGDRQAFSELYELYCPKIYAYVLRHVSGDVEVAQDLTSDVFVKAMEHVGTYRFQDVPFSSWLYRIAHNRVIDHYRRAPKLQPVALQDEDPVADKAASLDVSWILNRKVLYDAISMLTPEQRSVIVLRLLQSRSVAETAATIGRSEDAVKQLQRRGLAALERILQTPTLAPMPPMSCVSVA
ncbi:MAG TPA: sigma-70 family RNA polymerase sigma factor [Chloroflexota bacterium]|nr:sigma-70 family RNA polymerase sigma factor [Chloroflexota bacterium]